MFGVKCNCKVLTAILLIALTFTMFSSLSQVEVAKATNANWLPGWNWRRSVTIQGAPYAGSNYPISLMAHTFGGTSNSSDLYLNGKAKGDFGDLCFTSSDAITPLSYTNMTNIQPEISGLNMSFQGASVNENGTVFVGNRDTLYKSDNNGASWSVVKVWNNSNYMSVFVSSGSIFVSISGDNLPSSSWGMWRSTDYGLTWTHVLNLDSSSYQEIWLAFDSDSQGRLFVGTYTNTGNNASVYRSTDRGTSWLRVYYDPSARHIHDLKVDQASGSVYITVGDAPTYYIKRSVDSGNTWTQILSSTNQCLAIGITPTCRLFGSDDQSGKTVIYRTTDDVHYATVLIGSSPKNILWIRRDPDNGFLFASQYNENTEAGAIYYSANNGISWNIFLQLGLKHSGRASQFTNGILYSGCSGNSLAIGFKSLVYFSVSDSLSNSNATIYVYYGNSNATSRASPYNTFPLYDNFDGTAINQNVWQTFGSGKVAETNGTVIVASLTAQHQFLFSNRQFGLNAQIVCRAKVVAGSVISADVGFGTTNRTLRVFLEYYSQNVNFTVETRDGATVDSSSDLSLDNNYHIFRILRTSPNSVDAFIDDAHHVQATQSISTGQLPVVLKSYNGGAINCDWIYASPYVNGVKIMLLGPIENTLTIVT
jgi:hypothetical protein